MTEKSQPPSAQRLLDEWSNQRKTVLETIQAESEKQDAARLQAEHEARLGLRPPPPTIRRVA